MTDSPNGGLSTAGDTGAGARTRPTPENSREPPDLPLRPEQHAPRGVGVKDLRPLRGRPSGPIPDPNASTRRAPETGGRNAKRKDQEQERRLTGPAPSGMTARNAVAIPVTCGNGESAAQAVQFTALQVGSAQLRPARRVAGLCTSATAPVRRRLIGVGRAFRTRKSTKERVRCPRWRSRRLRVRRIKLPRTLRPAPVPARLRSLRRRDTHRRGDRLSMDRSGDRVGPWISGSGCRPPFRRPRARTSSRGPARPMARDSPAWARSTGWCTATTRRSPRWPRLLR